MALYEFKFSDITYFKATNYLRKNCIDFDANENWNTVWIYSDCVDFESHTYPELSKMAHSVKVIPDETVA